jgi:hypothetical protein
MVKILKRVKSVHDAESLTSKVLSGVARKLVLSGIRIKPLISRMLVLSDIATSDEYDLLGASDEEALYTYEWRG